MTDNQNKQSLKDTHKNFERFVSIIHAFSIKVNNLKKEEDVFWLITKELAPRLELVDCVIYKVDHSSKTLVQVAALGEKVSDEDEIKNRLVLEFGQGHVGMCYKNAESLIVDDVSRSPVYIKDVSTAGSEIAVPILIDNQVIGVVSSESPEKNFYTDSHRKLIEVIAIIAAGAIQRIQENNSLSKVKIQLEDIIHQKSTDLDRVIDTLSSQYSKMKYQHEKMELLIQEVHHRVNNNLQVISSLLSLYSSEAEGHEQFTLNSIKNRVQAMALIHQNIYKSVEMSTADVQSYVRDLMNHLRSVDETGVQCTFELKTSVKHINLNTLVPLGLLLVELFSKWMELCRSHSIPSVQFMISIDKLIEDEFKLTIYDSILVNLNLKDTLEDTTIASILISALVDQLEGELSTSFSKNNELTAYFKEV